MTTDNQTYHLQIMCPICGDLLLYTPIHIVQDSTRKKRHHLYCQVCNKFHDYTFEKSQVTLEIESERRQQKESIGKKILKSHEVCPSRQISNDCWLAYDLGAGGIVFYYPVTKHYELKIGLEKKYHFTDVSELLEFLSLNAERTIK